MDVLEAERMRLLDAELLQPQLGGVLLLQRRQPPLVPAAVTTLAAISAQPPSTDIQRLPYMYW